MAPSSGASIMTIQTIFHFLLAERRAILTIARTPHAIWIAILLVLSAGLSRNYDNEPLLYEPLHALGPLIASALIGTGLFLVLTLATRCPRTPGTGFLRRFIIFMTLYWMTAPMAWLYGIPWERLTDAATATELNLWTLALVSLWRVVLIGWIAALIFGVPAYRTVIVTLAYSNILAVVTLIALPFPIINVMGGIELSQSEALISAIATIVIMLSVFTVPILFLTSLGLLAAKPGTWQVPAPGTASDDRTDHEFGVPASPRIHRSVVILAVGAVLFWCALLPLTQPAQSLRFITEKALRTGDIDRGIDLMQTNGRRAYPVHWDPPPRRMYGEREPDMLDVLTHLADRPDAPDWVIETFSDKVSRTSLSDWTSEDSSRLLPVVQRMKHGPQLAYKMRRVIVYSRFDDRNDEQVRTIRAILEVATDYALANDLDPPDHSRLPPVYNDAEGSSPIQPLP